ASAGSRGRTSDRTLCGLRSARGGSGRRTSPPRLGRSWGDLPREAAGRPLPLLRLAHGAVLGGREPVAHQGDLARLGGLEVRELDPREEVLRLLGALVAPADLA